MKGKVVESRRAAPKAIEEYERVGDEVEDDFDELDQPQGDSSGSEGEEEDDSGPEQAWGDSDVSDEEEEPPQRQMDLSHLPLGERLKRLHEVEEISNIRGLNKRKQDKAFKDNRGRTSTGKEPRKRQKRDKNAPALMRSNRPVPILRDTSLVTIMPSVPKSVDPRFSEAHGTLNYQKFYKNFDFLDQIQETEVNAMEKKFRKYRDPARKEELKKMLDKSKQEMTERRRKQKIDERLQQMHREESEKVKEGKMPYFLKKSALKEVALDERYKELKETGKLQKYLAKKRKHNASKDHVKLPTRRSFD